MDKKKLFLNALEFRHACKVFDENKQISKEDFDFILEAGRLSPSSFGYEPWKFLIIENKKIREKMLAMTWGAQRTLPTASRFIIMLARNSEDLRPDSSYIEHIIKNVQKRPDIDERKKKFSNFQKNDFKLNSEEKMFDWACKQTYIPLANMMTAAAYIGIDSCPIEGFHREKLETLLEEEKILDSDHFGVSCMVAFGYRLEPQPAKTRKCLEESVKIIK